MVGIVALIADQPGAGCALAQQWRRDGDISDVAAGQVEGERPANRVDERVDFGRASAARAADGLAAFPPFAPLAARWARTAVLSIMATPGGSAQPASAA